MPDWPHAPPHRSFEPGTYMVTAGTLHKRRLFDTPGKLTLLQDTLLAVFAENGWKVQAWAVMINHYHIIAFHAETPETLPKAIAKVHGVSARGLNRIDASPGRSVWYQSWETRLDCRESYFARLHYVHENPVHHGVVAKASEYDWCSAGWLEQKADPAYRKMLYTFKIDRVNVFDDFD